MPLPNLLVTERRWGARPLWGRLRGGHQRETGPLASVWERDRTSLLRHAEEPARGELPVSISSLHSLRALAEALRFYRLGADQGFAPAQHKLGVMYAFGHGVLQDYAEAIKWSRLAANQGYADAQFNLGIAYANGQGVPKDYVSAYMWFNLSAALGNQAAAKNRDIAAQHMTPAQIAEAQKLAREWKPTK